IEHCRTEKFFPMLADIIRRIDGTSEERAAVAWASIREAIRRHAGDSIKFASPAMHYNCEDSHGLHRRGREVYECNASER
ncbi:MAG: hypothetical protein IJ576_02460, partial [Synergistaceae bacterium]|nr:hypothetical protein [Synergistaceae bacterium]MBR1417809.1 hypothetical protein [Synergistaceae bacterium]